MAAFSFSVWRKIFFGCKCGRVWQLQVDAAWVSMIHLIGAAIRCRFQLVP